MGGVDDMNTELALEEVRSIIEQQYQSESVTFGIDEKAHTIYVYTRKRTPSTILNQLEESGRRRGVHVIVRRAGPFRPAVPPPARSWGNKANL